MHYDVKLSHPSPYAGGAIHDGALHGRVDWLSIAEIDAQIAELLQLVLEQRSSSARKLFADKQSELDRERKINEEKLTEAKNRVQAARQAVVKRATVERATEHLKSIGGIGGLPPDMLHDVLLQLVEEVIVDTREKWFGVRGAIK